MQSFSLPDHELLQFLGRAWKSDFKTGDHRPWRQYLLSERRFAGDRPVRAYERHLHGCASDCRHLRPGAPGHRGTGTGAGRSHQPRPGPEPDDVHRRAHAGRRWQVLPCDPAGGGSGGCGRCHQRRFLCSDERPARRQGQGGAGRGPGAQRRIPLPI